MPGRERVRCLRLACGPRSERALKNTTADDASRAPIGMPVELVSCQVAW